MIIESILTEIISFLKKKNFFDIYNYFSKIKCYLLNLFKIENKFLLFSKELFTFEIIVKILEYYEKSKINKKEEIKVNEYENALKIIMEGEELVLSEKYAELNDNLKNLSECLKNILEEYSDEYCELMNYILVNRYKEKEDKDKYKRKFLSFVYNTNDTSYSLKKILNKDYPGLNEVILYYYENCCQNYFDKIKENEENNKNKNNISQDLFPNILCEKLCGNMSKNYLDLAITFMRDTYEKKNYNENDLAILGKHYSIAYIKRYINIYVKYLINNYYQKLSERKDINTLLFSEETTIGKEIRYYTLKLCLERKNNNYNEFLQFFNEDTIFDFKNLNMKLDDSKVFFYSLLSPDKTIIESYKKFYYDSKIKDNLKLKPFQTFYKNNKDIIYTYLYFNFYKSYLSDKNEDNEIKENLFSLYELNSEEEQFNKLIFNDNSFRTKVLPKLGIKNPQRIEILFYSFRFVFNILCEKKNNNFYYSLLTKNAIKAIEGNMIPGKLSNTNDLIKNFEIIKQNFKKNPNYSAYLCSCGYHYSIDFCSFPVKEYPCPKCNQTIGGIAHKLHRREGHKRIFYNKGYRDSNLSVDYADKTIPYIFFKDLEKEINYKKDQLFKGLKKEDKNYFMARREKVREIHYITFRILNFILHGFILYSNIIGNITDEYLNNNLIERMTCFDIMEADWNIIDSELKIKQVPNVQIFMNIIFTKVINIMKKQTDFSTETKLNNFEKEIDKIVQEELLNQKAIQDYIDNNDIMLDNNEISDKSIILENNVFNVKIDKIYPDMKYFNITKLPKIEAFIKEFNSLEENKDYYPIINYMIDIFEKNTNIINLKYLPTMNQLCNNVINYCSYRLSRDEAKTKLIKDELRDCNELIDNFISIYQKMRKMIKQYECHELKDKDGNLYFNDLNNNQYLSNFCVDVGEFNYGMVLTAIYKEMINWQNEFINIVLNSKNVYYKNYTGLLEQEIMIQDCTENEIVKFPDTKLIMNDIIIKHSYQKNYGVIIYNYQLIEEELASRILPSIKRFISDDDTCLRYVIYQFEGFRGNKSNIITKYIDKYKPKELNKDELKKISDFKNRYEKGENKKLIKFLFALQILIDIILDNNYNKNELISNVINTNKDNNENIDILNELFDNHDDEQQLFTIDTLINVFNIFEIICWPKIRENLINSYLMDINENIKKKFDDFFKEELNNINDDNNKNIINNKKIIRKVKLATAIRRYISRYLSGKRGQNEVNEKNNLMDYLFKRELWDEDGFVDNEEFITELSILFEDSGNNSATCVGQATKLYEFLGGDQSLLSEYFGKKEDSKINNDNNKDIINDIHEEEGKEEGQGQGEEEQGEKQGEGQEEGQGEEQGEEQDEEEQDEDEENDNEIGY